MSHSPFPWSIHPQVPHGVYDADGMKAAIAVSPNAEGNAALIAAIPAMIEALGQVLKDDREFRCCSSATLEQIDSVLASIGKKQ